MSETVAKLPRKLGGFKTRISVLSLAVDPQGALIAGSDKSELVVWTRDGQRKWGDKLEPNTQGFAFTKDGKELVIATRTGFRRIDVSDWRETASIPFDRESWPKLSRDGEWIVVEGPEKSVELIPTRDPDAKESFSGREACFADSEKMYIVRGNGEGNDEIFEHHLGGQFRALYTDQMHTTYLRDARVAGCYPGVIIITTAANGLIAYPIDNTVDGTRNPRPFPAHPKAIHSGGALALSLNISPMSQLFQLNTDGEWILLTFLPEGSDGAFGPGTQVYVADAEENVLTIWDYSDQRAVPIKDETAATALSRRFDGNWRPLHNDILGEISTSFLSPDNRWRLTASARGLSITDAKDGNEALAPRVYFGQYGRPEAAFSSEGNMFAIRNIPYNDKPQFLVWSLDGDGYYALMCRGATLLTFDKDAKDCNRLNHVPRALPFS
jgi:hypothetical protein